METHEIKMKFHELIDRIDDDDVLEGFFQALDNFQKGHGSKDIIDDLTTAQMNRLNESLYQSESENLIPHDVMKTEIKSWLTQ